MKLVIAEKPDAAKKMAGFLNVSGFKQGCIEGGGYIFTWGFGHLAELCPPEAYTGSKEWKMEELPIVPGKFKLQPAADKLQQVKIIKDLVNRPDVSEIINACDPDREGELIFRYIMEIIGGCTKPTSRVWLSTFTAADVKKAFSAPASATDYNNLGAAGRGRSEADWLVGMNATRALTLTAGKGGVLSLGRVQTATLAIICKRTLENKNFVATPFWNIVFMAEKSSVKFIAKTEQYKDKAEAEKALQIAKNAPKTVTDVSIEKVSQQPPLLHDLTSLQQEANKLLGLTAAQTDTIVQSLYQKGAMSYPRTDSQYIGENMFAEIRPKLETITIPEDYPLQLNRHCVNDSKVTGHHALIALNNGNDCTAEEKKVLDIVIIRMREAFAEPCEKNITKIQITAGYVLFKATGAQILLPGWTRFSSSAGKQDDEDKEAMENQQALPALHKDEQLAGTVELTEGKTKPQPLFTERSLIAYMKNCAKEIEDKGLKSALNNVEGIGRPATRSSIIETLFKRQYTIREKGKVIPTDLGFAVYGMVKNMTLANPIMTAQWEQKLDDVANGKLSISQFSNEITEYTRKVITEIKNISSASEVLAQARQQTVSAGLLKCPKCNKPSVRIGEKGAYCTQKCGFSIWGEQFKKKLTQKQVTDIVVKGATAEIKGFKGSKGEFSARLKLKADFSGVEPFWNKK